MSTLLRDRLTAHLPGRHRRPGLGRPFHLLWAGQTVSLLGDYVAYLTVPAFVVTLTDEALAFGQVYALENLPTLLFGFVGGVLLDRVRLRPILIMTDLLRALAFFVLAFVAGTEAPALGVVFLISFLVGTFAAAFTSGLYSVIPALVAQDRLASANSRLALSQQMTFVLGPVIGGVVAAMAGFRAAFLFNGTTFLVSALSVALVGPVPRPSRPTASFFQEAKEGFVHLWSDVRLRLLTVTGSIANFVVAFLESTFVLLGTRILGISELDHLGAMFGAMGVGGVTGALSASWVGKRLGLGRSTVVGLIVYGGGFVLVTFASSALAGLILLGITFVGLSWLNVGIVTLRQLVTPAHVLGRVTAASRALMWGALPFGALLGTWVADRIGFEVMARYSPLLVVGAGVLLIASPLWNATAAALPIPTNVHPTQNADEGSRPVQ